MTRTLAEFHGLLADHLISARRVYDGRPKAGEPGYLNDESADAVNRWRHLASEVHGYANGEPVKAGGKRPTWEDFWKDGLTRADFLKMIARRSRITRAVRDGGDMDAMLFDDSVRYWEYELASSVVVKADHLAAAERMNAREAVRRIGLELEVSLSLIQAYTGRDLGELRRALRECGSTRPAYPSARTDDGARVWESHPMLDLITTYRPTV
jgi:hypothetical protein